MTRVAIRTAALLVGLIVAFASRADRVLYEGVADLKAETDLIRAEHHHDWGRDTEKARWKMFSGTRDPFTADNTYSYLRVTERKTGRVLFTRPVPALTYLWISPDSKYVVGLSDIQLWNPYQLVVFTRNGDRVFERSMTENPWPGISKTVTNWVYWYMEPTPAIRLTQSGADVTLTIEDRRGTPRDFRFTLDKIGMRCRAIGEGYRWRDAWWKPSEKWNEVTPNQDELSWQPLLVKLAQVPVSTLESTYYLVGHSSADRCYVAVCGGFGNSCRFYEPPGPPTQFLNAIRRLADEGTLSSPDRVSEALGVQFVSDVTQLISNPDCSSSRERNNSHLSTRYAAVPGGPFQAGARFREKIPDGSLPVLLYVVSVTATCPGASHPPRRSSILWITRLEQEPCISAELAAEFIPYRSVFNLHGDSFQYRGRVDTVYLAFKEGCLTGVSVDQDERLPRE